MLVLCCDFYKKKKKENKKKLDGVKAFYENIQIA